MLQPISGSAASATDKMISTRTVVVAYSACVGGYVGLVGAALLAPEAVVAATVGGAAAGWVLGAAVTR